MESRTGSTDLASLVNRRLAERAQAVQDALRTALSGAEAALAEPLLTAEEVAAHAPRPAAGPDLGALRRWVVAIDDDRNQVNILKTLMLAAKEYARRVALFVVRDDKATGWAASGFTGCGTATDERVKAAAIPLAADTVLRTVATGGHGFSGGPSGQRQNELLFEALGNLEPAALAAFPLVNKGRVAAVLYADCGDAPDGIGAEALDILTRAATASIELIPHRGKAPTQAPAAAAHAAPTAHGAAAPAHAAAVPAHAAAGPARTAPAQPAAPAARPAATAPAATRAASGPDLSKLPPEEQKLHEAARRFARLLVSEIKLYNEAKVVEGRKARDIYTRLKEDIDRSKAMYYQRVNPKIAGSTNYFWDELVNSLAEGDASALAGYQ